MFTSFVLPLQRCNLYLSDIPPHDMARDFVLLAEQLKVESDLKEQLEVERSQRVPPQGLAPSSQFS